ncbi:MAG: tRNA preQ1(34) S-adenosylmethionine ribosyltransferase-isomerase QueA [Candidatus Hydrogenedentota bacterium]|nr:MAG: tRNA preQ1(34) S-adenosylmethionine ribosyltransferase-isomerase QueA [Candidatus Hydrogenedentota bacterium]
MQDKLLSEFDFYLPDDQIAKRPIHPPDHCKLMIVSRKDKTITHSIFYQLPEFIPENTFLFFNDSFVESRRVFVKRNTGATMEALFLDPLDKSKKQWKVLIRNAKRLKPGEVLYASKQPSIVFTFSREETNCILNSSISLTPSIFDAIGEMPIPPYLKRKADEKDKEEYQNPLGRNYGSVAAPTSLLHFTKQVQNNLRKKNVTLHPVTLHIGYGTFAPVTAENIQRKKLHPEKVYISKESTQAFRHAKANNKPIMIVGTTALRALETYYRSNMPEGDFTTTTDLYLFPPDKIYSGDMLLTNFHLPKSSLLHLVACMVEKEFLLQAYQEAIDKGYRFYSYGDAMLIL